MGYGTYDTSSSAARSAARAATGATAFTRSEDVTKGKAAALDPSMDLRIKSHRECRDNDDNPESIPVSIMLDVTGSMRRIPELVINEFHKLVTVIRDRGAVQHPSVLFGAVGDAAFDRAPIQMGEFESSDELAEKHLSHIYLEGGGGGNFGESYDLALWFMANKVETDHWDKRGQKGFLFVVGDEPLFDKVKAQQLEDVIGFAVEEDISMQAVVDKLHERWHVFILRPGGTQHFADPAVRATWTKFFMDERVVQVEDLNQIVPLIAGTISVMAGMDIADVVAAMKDSGFADAEAAGTTLAKVATSSVATVGGGPAGDDADTGAVRL